MTTVHQAVVGVAPLIMERGLEPHQTEISLDKSASSSNSSLNMDPVDDPPPPADKPKVKEVKDKPVKERDKEKHRESPRKSPARDERAPRRAASRSEEPSSTQPAPGSEDSPRPAVETVDRAVGPTPLPPPLPDTRLPPYFIPPYPDPRNGLEHSQFPYPYGSAYVPFGINVPLPVTSQTHEGRYQWPPSMTLPTVSHGITNPSYADLYTMGGRTLGASAAERVTDFANRIQWEQYRQMLSPTSLAAAAAAHHRAFSPTRGFSPVLSGLGSFLPQPGSGSVLSHRSMFSEHPATPSGSITLPGSLESSRLTSPRPSIVGKGGRKRALSHSPFSECGYLDIESLTRSSGGSLQLPFPTGNSRSSSATSGSYGHLSAATFGGGSPVGHSTPTHPLLRHPGLPTSPFMPPLMHPHMLGRHPSSLGTSLPPMQPMVQPLGPSKHETIHPSHHHSTRSPMIIEPGSSVVSSTVEHSDAKKTRVKREDPDSPGSSDGKSSGPRSVDPQRPPQEGEPDFIETNCHWKDCNREYETQDELVRHINQDHIQSNKKAFICQWSECSREEKPFKAQYMLVVHMRRHTGEKPHRCTFEGCHKAYSRLENLKTHLRSHTGEKPYMCEFPGCTKAFSNASDRAKHQNRTHSNAKPYVCKAPNCNKRYTDPSSLRKHVKTVHGPEFYANKKHKGDSGSSHNGGDRKGGGKKPGDDDQHQGGGGANVECAPRSVTTIKTEGGDSNDGFGTSTTGEQPRQNQSSSENGHSDNSPLSNQSDLGEGEDSNPAHTGPRGVSNVMGDEEENDDYSDDDVILPASTVGIATANMRTARHIQPGRLKNRLNAKSSAITGLPPTGNTQRRSDTTPKKHSPPHRKTITDLISQGSQESGIYLGSLRRDSNTSTLSSFISSGRSESSPFPYHNEVGSNSRLSVTNSPYEYDMPGRHSRHSSESGSVSHVAAQLEKARLGSQGSLNSAHLPMRPQSTGSRSSQERQVKGALRGHASEDGWKIGTTSSTPTRTPLPSEVPLSRVRRASEPIQCEEARQLQQRFNMNSNRSLPLSNSRRSLDKPPSTRSNYHCGSNFRSSCSSIATDYDGQDLQGQYLAESQDVNNMNDNDLLITDEMQRFLNEQYQQTVQRKQADSTVQDCGGSPRHVTPAPTQMYPQRSRSNSVAPSPQGHMNSVAASPSHMNVAASPSHMNVAASPSHMNVPPSPQGHMPSPGHMMSPGMSPGHMMSPGGNMGQHMGPMNSPSHMASPAHMMSPGSMTSQGPMPSPGQMSQMAGPQMNSSPWPQHGPQNGLPNGPHALQNGLHGVQNSQHGIPNGPQGPHGLPNGPHCAQNGTHLSRNAQQGVRKIDGSSCNSCQHTNYMQPNSHMSDMSQQYQQYYNMQQYPQNAQNSMQEMSQGYGPYPQNYPGYNQWRGQGEMQSYGPVQGNMYAGYNNMGQQQPGPMNGGQKPERGSPMIQVPQVSQSQPPHMKRRGYPPQQSDYNQMAYQYQQYNQYSGYYPMQQQYGPNMPSPNMPSMNQVNPMQNSSMGVRNMQGYNQMDDMNHNERVNMRPSCGGGPMGVQMSPGHNQVSSTTDVKECQTDIESVMEENLHAVSTDNLLDNLSSISMEHIPGQVMLSPTQLAMTRSASQNSSRMNTGTPYTDGKMSQASYLETSNMVVNDMSSVLTQLAEENRYLNLR